MKITKERYVLLKAKQEMRLRFMNEEIRNRLSSMGITIPKDVLISCDETKTKKIELGLVDLDKLMAFSDTCKSDKEKRDFEVCIGYFRLQRARHWPNGINCHIRYVDSRTSVDLFTREENEEQPQKPGYKEWSSQMIDFLKEHYPERDIKKIQLQTMFPVDLKNCPINKIFTEILRESRPSIQRTAKHLHFYITAILTQICREHRIVQRVPKKNEFRRLENEI